MIRHTIYPTLPVGALYSFDQIPRLLDKENVILSEESTEEYLFTCLTACLPKSRALKVLSHMVSKGILVYKDNVEYDVEAILDDDHDMDEKKTYYYVKWEGWPLAFCTWEPEENFVSNEVIEVYKSSKKMKSLSRYIDDDVSVPELLSRLRSCVNSYVTTPAVIVQAVRDALKFKGRWCNSENAENCGSLPEQPFRPKPRIPSGKLGINSRKIRRRAMPGPRSKAYQALREKSQRALKEWEKEINAKVLPKEARIFVENYVDLEGPPSDFTFITDYSPGKGVHIDNEPVVGCVCTDCYAERKTACCSAMAIGTVPYSTARRLRLDPGEPIYECNKLCPCGDDCPFRVVQRGRQVKLTIYRTHNRGWGIKAVNKIKKGTFVMEYVGEVISCEEAETRGRQYDEEAMTYLFDLDFIGDPLYSVDARYMGNISHFVNHSCDPNLSTHCVYVNCMDLYLPRLALFALRDVHAGEELCFDYRMTGVIAESHKSMNASGLLRTSSPSTQEHASGSSKMQSHLIGAHESIRSPHLSRTRSPILENHIPSFTSDSSRKHVVETDKCANTRQFPTAITKDNASHGSPTSLKTSSNELEETEDNSPFLIPALVNTDDVESQRKSIEERSVNFDNLSVDSSFERSSVTGSETSGRGRMKCLCGAKNCRGYLY